MQDVRDTSGYSTTPFLRAVLCRIPSRNAQGAWVLFLIFFLHFVFLSPSGQFISTWISLRGCPRLSPPLVSASWLLFVVIWLCAFRFSVSVRHIRSSHLVYLNSFCVDRCFSYFVLSAPFYLPYSESYVFTFNLSGFLFFILFCNSSDFCIG